MDEDVMENMTCREVDSVSSGFGSDLDTRHTVGAHTVPCSSY